MRLKPDLGGQASGEEDIDEVDDEDDHHDHDDDGIDAGVLVGDKYTMTPGRVGMQMAMLPVRMPPYFFTAALWHMSIRIPRFAANWETPSPDQPMSTKVRILPSIKPACPSPRECYGLITLDATP